MKLSFKKLICCFVADRRREHGISATYWGYYGYGPKARGYYGTPYNGGPQRGDGSGDYSCARQAPNGYW